MLCLCVALEAQVCCNGRDASVNKKSNVGQVYDRYDGEEKKRKLEVCGKQKVREEVDKGKI